VVCEVERLERVTGPHGPGSALELGRGCVAVHVWKTHDPCSFGHRTSLINSRSLDGSIGVSTPAQAGGSASSINITYTDGSGNTEQQNGLAVPLTTKSVSAGISAGISFASNSGHFAYISAQNQGDSGTLDCTIEGDGQVLNTGHASGAYAIASCSTFVQ
jgi:hypothetical protein